jgi:hypothetical protein
MLKQSPFSKRRSRIIQRFNESYSEVGSTGGDCPFAKIYCKGRSPEYSTVLSSLPLVNRAGEQLLFGWSPRQAQRIGPMHVRIDLLESSELIR